MVKKVIIIEDCSECPHCYDGYNSGRSGFYCERKNERLDQFFTILDDCPLGEYDEND
jgi:hypothetical protein